MIRTLVVLALACAAAFSLPSSAAAQRDALRRFALIAGANDGGPSRVRLRYAGSDARAMARVLEELGGVDPSDRLLLVDFDRADLQRALVELQARLEAARRGGERLELFVYYSGHSDEEGLLLGGERFGYAELREALERLPADVRVAILDSCASGALTRRKGGVRRPPFLVDAASHVQGHAFLTSSSADEAAQESDRIGASFFTHFLLSGLRGAADTSRDGKVTLNEAYQFAFAETLARTSRTSAGAQHPAYEMQLAGTGDLVMTDLRSTAAGLVVDEAVGGRIFVRDESGALVVELRKERMAPPVELGLAPGAYVVTVDDRGALSEARVVLTVGGRERVSPAHLTPIEGEPGRVRGDDPEAWIDAPVVLGIAPGASTLPSGVPEDRVVTRFGINLLGGRTARLDGTAIGLGLNWYTDRAEGTMIAGAGNLVGGDARAAQFAAGFNHVEGRVDGAQFAAGFNGANGGGTGAQIASIANWSGGGFGGAQLSGGLNWSAGNVSGAQIAAGLNWIQRSDDEAPALDGAQIAAGVNFAGGALVGLQATAGLNLATGDAHGVQIAAGANLADGLVDGTQLTAGLNWARRIEGAQIGVVNVGGSTEGAQIGVVNIATGAVSGTQIGVFNYADEVDVPIGVVSVVRRGRFDFALWADDVNVGNAAFRLGSRYVYTLFTAGLSGRESRNGALRWTTGLGIGGHVPVGAAALSFLDLELLARSVHYGDPFAEDDAYLGIATLRVGGGWRLLPRLAIVAGPSLNLAISDREGARGGFGAFGRPATLHEDEDVVVRLWPGFHAGLQF